MQKNPRGRGGSLSLTKHGAQASAGPTRDVHLATIRTGEATAAGLWGLRPYLGAEGPQLHLSTAWGELLAFFSPSSTVWKLQRNIHRALRLLSHSNTAPTPR